MLGRILGEDLGEDPDSPPPEEGWPRQQPRTGWSDMSEIKLLSSKTVFTGKLISVRVDEIEEENKKVVREVVMSPNAVCIVARPTPDQVILIRQYRHATGKTLLEIPAGGLKPNEDPKLAA